ncbi:MAG: hypothetical protein ACTJGR_02545 [Pauljensenia sp.]
MSYPITSPDGHAVVGNSQTREYHLVGHLVRNCQVDEIIRANHLVAFYPDRIAQALGEGFDPCDYFAK